jgi:hypothetical protein
MINVVSHKLFNLLPCVAYFSLLHTLLAGAAAVVIVLFLIIPSFTFSAASLTC